MCAYIHLELPLNFLTNISSGWSGATYQVPSISRMPSKEVFSNVRMDMHNPLWRFYRRTGDFSIPERTSSAMQTAAEYAKLSLLIRQTINAYYDSHGIKLTAKDILEQYKNYLGWKEALPEELSNVSLEDQALPHVISLQYVPSS